MTIQNQVQNLYYKINNLEVEKNSTFNVNNFNSLADINANGNLSVAGSSILADVTATTISSSGNITTAGNIAINGGGITTIASSVGIFNGSSVTDITFGGQCSTVSIGATNGAGTTTIQNTASIDGKLTVAGPLTASGGISTSTISGSSTLQAGGAATFGSTISSSGNITTAGNIAINGGGITTIASSVGIFNGSNVTDITFGGQCSTVSIGATNGTGTTTIQNTASIDGKLTVTGPLTASNGIYSAQNIILANGKGIDFSATSDVAGMTGELFDDYEEGTWTPRMFPTSYSSQYITGSGYYTKIGNMVYLSGKVSGLIPTTPNPLSSGMAIKIGNLPFTSYSGDATDSTTGELKVTFHDNTTQNSSFYSFIGKGATATDYLYYGNVNTYLNWGAANANYRYYFSLSYKTA